MGMCREWRTGRIPRFEDGLLLVFIRWIGRGLCRILLNPKGGLEATLRVTKTWAEPDPIPGCAEAGIRDQNRPNIVKRGQFRMALALHQVIDMHRVTGPKC